MVLVLCQLLVRGGGGFEQGRKGSLWQELGEVH